jgi:hypothetical protein
MRSLEGESDRQPLRPVFDHRLEPEFRGSRVTPTPLIDGLRRRFPGGGLIEGEGEMTAGEAC